MGQYLKGYKMAPIQGIMVDVMRMHKLLMLITSVSVEIQLNLQEHSFMGQYLKGNNMAQIKFIVADIMRMCKLLMLITSV